MTTFEALGAQFNNRRFFYNSLMAIIVIFMVIAGTAIITADIMNRTTSITTTSTSPVSTSPITFPTSSEKCLQNCSPAQVQTQQPSVQATPATLQSAANLQPNGIRVQ